MFALRSMAGRAATWAVAGAGATSPMLSSLRSTALRTMATTTTSGARLEKLGITSGATVHHNLSYDEIYEHEVANDEGVTTSTGAFAIDTGKFTGRSPGDKYFVSQAPSNDNIWWGEVNRATTTEVFTELKDHAVEHLNGADKLYVFDGLCGSTKKSQIRVRFITEKAWQHHFVRNMFIRDDSIDAGSFEPDFVIINACSATAPGWKEKGLNSEVAVAFNVEEKTAVILGTHYGGEMKKGIFSMMNYYLPLDGVMAMHCSANKDPETNSTALFFGLSGTGKTTLSADPDRDLIGDDEHGWDESGVFNFEGGCYAKTINLTRENEPEIWDAIKRDALLENVVVKGPDNTPDYNDVSKTENGRVSYPIYHIPNYEKTSSGGHPSDIIFLTCDAFGVLPPVSKLTPEQAQYHFLSGYTAKVAGTERGVTEPQPTFSACFGAAFLPLHPTKYAALLQRKMESHGTNAYLVNTGWTGGKAGAPGAGRISIKNTRACITAILDGSINSAEFRHDHRFNVDVPTSLPNVDAGLLDPRSTWADGDAYDAQSLELATLFVNNFKKYADGEVDYTPFGPRVD